MRSKFWPWLLASIAALLLSAPFHVLDAEPTPPSPSPSASASSNPPVKAKLLELSADRAHIDMESKSAVLEGHVHLSRAGVTMDCARVEARFGDAFALLWAKGSGGVSASIQGVSIQAPQAEADFKSQTMVFSGGVKLTKGDAFLSAQKASVKLDSGKVSLDDVKGALAVGQ